VIAPVEKTPETKIYVSQRQHKGTNQKAVY